MKMLAGVGMQRKGGVNVQVYDVRTYNNADETSLIEQDVMVGNCGTKSYDDLRSCHDWCILKREEKDNIVHTKTQQRSWRGGRGEQ